MENFWNVTNQLTLTWSSTCVITNSSGGGIFATTDTKHFVLVITLSTHDNTKLFQQLKSGFKITIDWNKYQSKVSVERRN